MSDENKELNDILKSAAETKIREATLRTSSSPCGGGGGEVVDDETESRGKLSQFTTSDGIKFFPAGRTVASMTPGVFEIKISPQAGIYFEKVPIKTEGLIRFPETNSDRVIAEITDFWDKEELYGKFGLAHKRGMILWGPPGSGKSSCIQLVTSDLINRGGIVFKFGVPEIFREGLRQFRQIQPDTPVVVLMEDIDATLEMFNESEVLNILDGVDRIQKVVFLATTNYPERLGARILNRPSRFDKRFKMPHPCESSRDLYLKHLIDTETRNEFEIDFDKWVKDSEGMSIAHLKELFTAVVILGNDYGEAIDTLQTMVETTPHSKNDGNEEVYSQGMGFASMNKKGSIRNR